MPQHWRTDALGAPVLAPCGWVARRGAVETDIEAAFDAILAAADLPLPDDPDTLAFARLTCRLTGPFEELPLGVGSEALRLAEALHEDILFSLLERFRARRSGDPHDRAALIGQIVPETIAVPDAEHWTVEVRREDPPPAAPPSRAPTRDLTTADTPLTLDEATAALDALGGRPADLTSRQGRLVAARQFGDPERAILISGAQHGNEATGVVGALRAAETLLAEGVADLTLQPVENPDGYALTAALAARQPGHMLHAGRFTAGGHDLTHRAEFEGAARDRARAGAGLHVNLHGYPAAEWVRPFSGYIPGGYGGWMLPQGFLLILRHWPGEGAAARRVAEAAAAAAAEDPALVALNRAQLARARRYRPGAAPELIGDIPVFFG
ncbi:MAG: peptidase M14, partial [Pseudomonadota bacterium]